MASKPILKQFGELSAEAFSGHPVWIGCHTTDYDEPWYEETDEETFRPWTGKLPVNPSEGVLLVRARLAFADGTAFPGFVTPQFPKDPPDLGMQQPQMFLPVGKVRGFWCGMFEPNRGEILSFYKEVERDSARVFPIKYAAEPGLTGGLASGIIPGFCYCPADKVLIVL